MTKLTDLCDIQYGYAFDSGAFTNDNSYPQLVRIRDVKRGYSETFYNGDYPDEYVLSAGDLLIGMDGEFNIARWKIDGALLNQRVCKIVAKDNTDEEFLRFALSKALKVIEDRTSFVTVKHLSARELNKLEIQVPSYDEQKKISDILHRLERIIDARQNELKSLDILIKARFVEMFGDLLVNSKGYPIKKLPEISEYWNGLTYKPDEVADNGTIVLRSSNIQNGDLDFDDIVRVKCSIGERKFVKNNDILMCSRNGSARLVGKVALINNICEPMSFGAFMMIIRSEYYSYLMTFFQMDAFRTQITTGATTTINQITGKMLDDVKLPVPDLIEIEPFTRFVQQINKSKVVVPSKIKNAIFAIMLSVSFGQITSI
jgi:type I restriction enzyme S subunit